MSSIPSSSTRTPKYYMIPTTKDETIKVDGENPKDMEITIVLALEKYLEFDEKRDIKLSAGAMNEYKEACKEHWLLNREFPKNRLRVNFRRAWGVDDLFYCYDKIPDENSIWYPILPVIVTERPVWTPRQPQPQGSPATQPTERAPVTAKHRMSPNLLIDAASVANSKRPVPATRTTPPVSREGTAATTEQLGLHTLKSFTANPPSTLASTGVVAPAAVAPGSSVTNALTSPISQEGLANRFKAHPPFTLASTGVVPSGLADWGKTGGGPPDSALWRMRGAHQRNERTSTHGRPPTEPLSFEQAMNRDDTEIVATIGKKKLTAKAFKGLKPGKCLDCDVLDHYFELLGREGRHFFPSSFVSVLEGNGGVDRMVKSDLTPGKEIFEMQKLYFPVFNNSHWMFMEVLVPDRKMYFYDFMKRRENETAPGPKYMNILKEYISKLHRVKLGREDDRRDDWDLVDLTGGKLLPHQENDTDCGVILLECCKLLSRDQWFPEELELNVAECRQSIGESILQGKLLN